MKNLPPVKSNLKEIEKSASPSIDVLIKIKGHSEPTIGRYIHGGEFWQSSTMSGQVEVEEWWPLPVSGTGFTPNIESEFPTLKIIRGKSIDALLAVINAAKLALELVECPDISIDHNLNKKTITLCNQALQKLRNISYE